MTDYNSTENQEIKRKFVDREVFTCFSYEMDSILKVSSDVNSDLPSYEDIENLYYFDREEVFYKIIDELNFKKTEMFGYANDPDTFNRKIKTENDFEVFLNSLNDEEIQELCDTFGIDVDDAISKPQEIYEWWIVSQFLYTKLKNEGEPVLEWGNNYYWGRTCTGQAILLDRVISRICSDLEILDGQKYAWNK